ncbi:MAG: ATP-binding protein [Bacteroidales bacterium]|nr:ATP-binding protein [Bacteroidales bacterium]
MLERDIKNRILSKLQPQKVALLYGARRVGKTVLTQQVAASVGSNVIFLNGEEPQTVAMLSERSGANYQSLFRDAELLVVDEAQNVAAIGQVLKLIVDTCPWLKVMASGSSSFDLQQQVGEPLVGRAYEFRLFPFSLNELSAVVPRTDLWKHLEEFLVYGCYPELYGIGSLKDKEDYLYEVSQAYLYKDVLSIEGVKNSSKMRQLLQLLAYQVGQEVSYEELASKLGLSRNTVEKYVDLLCKTFVIYRLPAFSRNPRKEVTRPGKIYFADNGIRNALIGDFRHFALRQDIGALWENYIIAERVKKLNNRGERANLYFWRTYEGQEVDLVEEVGDELRAFEFKWGSRSPEVPSAFAKLYPNATYEVVNRTNFLDFAI